MSLVVTDRNDPRLIEGQKNEEGIHDTYLVLSEEERAKGFVRPYRDTYVHVGILSEETALKKMKHFGGCGVATKMGKAIAETYAVNPKFYGLTFCVGCNKHYPVGEFVWSGTNETVGS